jgi:hypothetical protein
MYRLYWTTINTLETNTATSRSGSINNEVDSTFSRPLVISKLGHYIMDVKRELKRENFGWQNKKLFPLILLARR